MITRRSFSTIDTHTVGEPTRSVIGGLPPIPGKTMSEKMLYMQDNMDWIRKLLMFEPRGSQVMSGTFIMDPCLPEADFGIVYMEVGGFLNMCGHDTIGVCTALIESGMIEPKEPITQIKLDTPAGLVVVDVKVENYTAKEVTFTNVPSFVFAKETKVNVPGFGKIAVDISYGGLFYAIIKANDIDLDISPKNATEIIRVAHLCKQAINSQVNIYHPEKPYLKEVTHIEFSTEPTNPNADLKNAVVFPPGAIDRSPCGTGTSAKAASLFMRGQLKVGETFVHESIIGSLFKCKVLRTTQVGDFKAIIPQVSGKAYVTGFHTFVLDPEDPFQEGFQIL